MPIAYGVVADLDLARITERERLEAVRVDLEQREVVGRVRADDLGGDLLAVGADLHGHLLGAVDDVLFVTIRPLSSTTKPEPVAWPSAVVDEMKATESWAPS